MSNPRVTDILARDSAEELLEMLYAQWEDAEQRVRNAVAVRARIERQMAIARMRARGESKARRCA